MTRHTDPVVNLQKKRKLTGATTGVTPWSVALVAMDVE